MNILLIDKTVSNYPGALIKEEVDKLISLSKRPVLTVYKEFVVPEINNISIPIGITQ